MTTKPREIKNMPNGEARAAALHKVANAALFAVGSIEDDPFPRWRLSAIRTVRSRTKPYAHTVGEQPTAEEMEQALSLCRDLAPTPHEKMDYAAEHDGKHSNLPFRETPVALRPLIGDKLPQPIEGES